MKYDTNFWKKVLEEFKNNNYWAICGCSNLFKDSWFNSIAFKIKLQSIAENWPDIPSYSIVESCSCYLFLNDYFNEEEERQTRIDFLKYLIKNKIEFEV